MKATFFCRLLNDPFSDPTLYIRLKREKRAFLFDAGDVSGLSMGEVQKITHLFVTHMHIDHFIGFDHLLRALIGRETPLSVYGPEGIINAVWGKLRGYTWNLIREYPLMIEVFEVRKEKVLHASFYAPEGFSRIDRESGTLKGTIFSDLGYSVGASIFDHDIPVLGFNLSEPFHINIDKALLLERRLPVGPWLGEFKEAIRRGNRRQTFFIDGKYHAMDDLNDLALITRGQKITYITDISPDRENISRAVDLAGDSDTLYIEAFFLDEESERALKRKHLTAKCAGMIAREAGVRSLELIHISTKYVSMPEKIMEEAMREFRG